MAIATTVVLVLLLFAVIGLVVYFAVSGLPALQRSIDTVIVFVNTAIVAISGVAVNVFDEVGNLLNTTEQFVVGIAEDITSAVATGLNTVFTAITNLATQILN